ncbi:hypothetical protein LEP1GSC061_2096 [Leptospira wolffii serovar Khorat str. Khorat-H2]|nr:hypothetical protein LEP1GSC061_2096 [Leptospira wolffii serovar Khorat str. Khorat-H2]
MIPFKKFCKNETEAIALIEKVFEDIIEQKDLVDFTISKDVKKGIGGAIFDSLILEPNFNGFGFSFKKFIEYFKTG